MHGNNVVCVLYTCERKVHQINYDLYAGDIVWAVEYSDVSYLCIYVHVGFGGIEQFGLKQNEASERVRICINVYNVFACLLKNVPIS